MAGIELRVLDTRISARFGRPWPSDVIVGSATPLTALMGKIKAACC
jgi:hypothetical protein